MCYEAVVNGRLVWIDNDAPDKVVSYIKKSDKQELLVIVNTKNEPVSVRINQEFSRLIISSGCTTTDGIELEGYGYLVAEI